MTINELRIALEQRPFTPFALVLGDGSELSVEEPELVGLPPRQTKGESFVYVMHPGVPRPLSASSVVKIQPLQPSDSSHGR